MMTLVVECSATEEQEEQNYYNYDYDDYYY